MADPILTFATITALAAISIAGIANAQPTQQSSDGCCQSKCTAGFQTGYGPLSPI
jgi:hypothetical protein